MIRRAWAYGGAFLLAGTGALALATPAAAQAEPKLTVSAELTADCGEVTLTFVNGDVRPFAGDYRIGAEPGEPDEYSEVTIRNGPFAGELLGDRYRQVALPAEQTTEVVVAAEGEVSFRIWRGPENDWYVPWQTIDVPACPEPEPDPLPVETETPAPTCVDVNAADTDALQRLRHIGPDRASQIVELRPFSDVDDLGRVDGLRAGGTRLAELVAGGGDFLPLCDIAAQPAPVPDEGQGGGSTLPVTGAATPVLLGAGTLLAAVGSAALWFGRRRRPASIME